MMMKVVLMTVRMLSMLLIVKETLKKKQKQQRLIQELSQLRSYHCLLGLIRSKKDRYY
jgi:hypothetical protein